MTKFYAQEKRVFDINKVTVVGSPTITSDGVASGFSSSNYISLSPININNIQRLDIECSFLVGNNISTQQFPFGSTAYAQLSVQIRNGILMANTGTNNSWHGDINIITNLQPNTLVYLKCHFTTKGRSFEYSTDGVNYISVTGDTFTLIGDTYAFTPRIGLGRSGAAPFLGSIDLAAFKIYVDGELVYSPTKPVYSLERRKPMVWDKEQFTVLGSPVISDSGVASGFSASNYIRVPYISLSQNFKIFTPKFNSTNVSQQQKIVRYSDGNIRIEIYNSKIRLFRYTANNVYDLPTGKTILQNNTDYYYYVEQTTNGTNYYLKGYISTDGINWALDIDKTFSTAMYDYSNSAPIQISGADATQPFLGTLNLKSFKIYTDNNLVFDGGKDRYLYDSSKFTVVGSPTITEAGVASGFTKDNYLSILPIIQLGNYDNWELVSPKFTTSNTINGVSQAVFGATYNTWHGGIRIGVTSNGKLYTQLASQANTDNDILMLNSVNAMPNNTYQIKIKFTGLQYIVWYKVNNADWVEYGKVQTSTKVYNTWTEMFVGNMPNMSFLGSIDLPSTSITVDGKEVFTGAKEKFYAMRRM